MAGSLTVTDRQVDSHGARKRETGKVTVSAWDASEWIETKLGNIMWFKMQSVDGTADAEYVAIKNTTSGVAAKNGHVLLVSDGQAATYTYCAISRS